MRIPVLIGQSVAQAGLVCSLVLLPSCVKKKTAESSSSSMLSWPWSHSPSQAVVGDVKLTQNANLLLGYPQGADLTAEVFISRKQYAISWNIRKREPNWVAWLLQAGDLGDTGRAGSFKADPDLDALSAKMPAVRAVSPDEYQDSCFDRGHLAPSGDRTNNLIDDQATFLMSNIIPQTAYLNRDIWAHLEAYERTLVTQGAIHRLMIFAGPIFGTQPEHIGPHQDIAVPLASFKIIAPVDDSKASGLNGDQIIAVIMPNITSRGTDPLTDRATACQETTGFDNGAADDWKRFRTSVREIEQQSGLDFPFLSQ